MAKVYGSLINNETRCTHYYSSLDVIAIKSGCRNRYYPRYRCHNEHVSHTIERRTEDESDEKVIMCGVCKHEMRIRDYMMVEMYPRCKMHSNSRCKFHYHLHFEA